MKINYIYIDGYKNLKKIELSFDKDSAVNALIGNNGSGKSNVIEALTKVFTSVYNDSTVDFVYEIHYMISDNEIVLSNKEKTVFLKNGKSVKKSEREVFLPRSIFLYYCGETDRLQKLASNCQDKKFQKALKTDGEAIEILGLDCSPLVNLRRAAIDPYLDLDLDNEGWNAEIEALSQRHNGNFHSFCFVVIYYIKNFKISV